VGADRCTVELEGGLRVEALAVTSGGPGTRTTLSIRPERVLVWPGPGRCENRVTATIEELIYHGDHRRVRLRLPNGNDFLIKVPNADRAEALAPGGRIEVGWRRRDCRALDAP
jgi:putative spermidine/putrescine transport system ATP-binding protein